MAKKRAKKRDAWRGCCFAAINLLLFSSLFAFAGVVTLGPYCCDLEILLP